MKPSPIDRYLRELAQGLDALPPAAREEHLAEVRVHLEEAALASPAADPLEREADAVGRFGPAGEIAAAITAETLLTAAASGFHPVGTARAMAHALTGGAAWTLLALGFSLCYVALLGLALVSVARLWLPAAGLWIHPDGAWSLSLGGFEQSKEILGPWLPLYGPLLALLGWLALNRVLRLVIGLGRPVSRRKRETV